MSVALLSVEEFGQFVADGIRAKIVPCDPAELSAIYKTLELVSLGNIMAYRETYNETPEFDHASADEIERASLDILAGRYSAGHWGPIAYNCISNCGKAFLGGVSVPQDYPILSALLQLEERVREWSRLQELKEKQQTENVAAFDDCPQLPKLPGSEIAQRCRIAGCDRVIIARYSVNESDSMTGYYGGRIAREIVIGFGKDKRENFKQLRAAAGKFGPTKNFGPGCGRFFVRPVHNETYRSNGRWINESTYSAWHGNKNCQEFLTSELAEQWIQKSGKPHDVIDGEQVATFRWEISEREIEHRENYSMGGGNYLGDSRYGGWQVRSVLVEYFGNSPMEFFES